MENGDWFRILDVSPGATQKEIKQAYLKACKLLHPDVNQAPGAQDQFKQVQLAYEILSDPARRTMFELERASHGRPQGVRPKHASGRGPRAAASFGEVFLGKNLRWVMIFLAPVWVVGYVGLSTLQTEDPKRFDGEEKMVRAGFDEKSGTWIQPTYDNMKALGPNRQLHMVPYSWIGTKGKQQ